MKTFSRRRKSSQPDELTNGTPERNAGPILETGKEASKYSKDSEGADVLEFAPSLGRSDGKCERGVSLFNKWTGIKRKPSGSLNLVQRKAGRVESSPANTDVLELPNATPTNDDQLPAATPLCSEPESMDGQAPMLRPRGDRQSHLQPSIQEQTLSAQPLEPSCTGGTSVQVMQRKSSSILPSRSPVATGRSLFSHRLVCGGGELAPSLTGSPAVTPNAARATASSGCLKTVCGGASEGAAGCGDHGCRLGSVSGTDTPVNIGGTGSGLEIGKNVKNLRAPGSGLEAQGVETDGWSEIGMAVVSAAGAQPLLPGTVSGADRVTPTKMAAMLQPAAAVPRLPQQHTKSPRDEEKAIQNQKQLQKHGSRLSGEQKDEVLLSQHELLKELEEQQKEREKRETHLNVQVRRPRLPQARPSLEQQQQQQEWPHQFLRVQEPLASTSLDGESQLRLTVVTAACTAFASAAAASTSLPLSGQEPIPQSHPPRLARSTLIPIIPTACQAVIAKVATPSKATVAAASIPGTMASGAASTTSPAGTGSGRAGRPIGRGRLPTSKLPVGASQGPPSTATVGGSKHAGASQGVAITLTPLKSIPTTTPGLGSARGTSGVPGTVRIGAGGARQAAGLLGSSGTSAGPGFGGGMSQGGGGGGSSRGRMGSQGDSDVAAHSILEAQERGELLQLQDDAQYALDGLASAEKAMATSAPVGCGGVVREAAVALAAILATRRGRAALSQPVNLAMKALTSLARLSVVPRDAVAALAAAVIILSLVQEDAMPAYGASYAAALLLRQVLVQAEQDQPPELQSHPQGTTASASAPALLTVAIGCPAGGASAWALLRGARSMVSAAGGDSGGGGGAMGSTAAAAAAAAGRGGGGGSMAGIGDGGDGSKGTALRLVRLIQEGPLARHIGRADLVEGPLPLALLAMVMASEASPSRIKYAERFKDNLSRVGILPLLARLVTARRDAVVRHVNDKRDAEAAAATHICKSIEGLGAGDYACGKDVSTSPLPTRPPSPVRDTIPRMPKDPYAFEGSQPTDISLCQSASSPQLLPVASGAAAVVPVPAPLPLWCLWELQLLLRVIENATFTHACNENGLIALRVCTSVPLKHAAAATATVAAAATATIITGTAAGDPAGNPLPQLLSSQPDEITRFGSSQPRMGSQPLTGSQSSQPNLEPIEILKQDSIGDGDTVAAAVTAGKGAPFAAVLVDIVRQLTDLIDDGNYSDNGNTAGGPTGTGVGRGGTSAPPAVPVPPSAAAVCQVAAAVLMNLTHEHPDGVQVVAAAGGLQALGDLVWRCCRPQRVSPAPAGQCQHQAAPALATRYTFQQGLRLQVCLDSIVSSIDILSVALGLLINMTSQSAANQRALRAVVLMAAAQQPPLPPPASAAQAQPCPAQASPLHPVFEPQAAPRLQLERMKQDDQRKKAVTDGDVSLPRMVPLLCAVLNAMAHKPAGRVKAASSEGPPPFWKLEDGDGGANAVHLDGNGDPGRGTVDKTTAEQGVAAVAGSGSGGDVGLRPSLLTGEEVTEATLEEDLQGGHASIAQVYSAILLGNLLAGTEADGDTDASGGGGGSGGAAVEQGDAAPEGSSAAAARAEARRLLCGGSLRPVTCGISRCLAFYCRADAITEGSKDTLKALLQRVHRFEALENRATGTAMAAAAVAVGTEPDVYSESRMSES
ncbi:hypothetical protein VaNZ11_014784 [Volvox africanus]|uniref:Wings apart-like protein C-terminal domain-containing protein n=1 Tax=Volvox africanus TaxID=51714 RepID=A0ABQ5SLY6_9CHLO|nr:hypothetical protein VaNZ11_014784 [Volvox africanus]